MSNIARFRRTGLFAVYIFLLVGGWYIGSLLFELSDIEVRPSNEPIVHKMIMATTGIFTIASALPFVPGAEIGFGLILVFGKKIALLVYLSMVAALTLAYLIGLLVPPRLTSSVFRFFGLNRAHDLVQGLAKLDPSAKLDFLLNNAPRRFVPFLLRHRYLALIILFNLPGNSLIGGGGGIAFSAGLSGLFSFPRYLTAVSIAIAPVPAIFMLTG
jgi:hypothetical protein